MVVAVTRWAFVEQNSHTTGHGESGVVAVIRHPRVPCDVRVAQGWASNDAFDLVKDFVIAKLNQDG